MSTCNYTEFLVALPVFVKQIIGPIDTQTVRTGFEMERKCVCVCGTNDGKTWPKLVKATSSISPRVSALMDWLVAELEDKCVLVG